MEIRKDIPNYEGYYQASSEGNISRCLNGYMKATRGFKWQYELKPIN